MTVDLTEKELSSKQLFSGRLLEVYIDKVLLPNGETSTREWIDHPGAACIIPIFPNGKLGLIRQYRYAAKNEFIEFPAGKLDKGESPESCAKRELEEEIGYTTKTLTFLTNIHPAIGFCNEKMWIYLAENLTKTSEKKDEDEFLELIQTTPEKAIKMVKNGEITDVKTVIGLLWFCFLEKN
ncbi:MAG: ADP-ribose pyrophosphatase [Candidatus Marinimicrobia bacterium]|nr:ADP-ribose pyrophosphatase [Candidatus Neomarinimicrobiota bacterium]|tara:strand:- start:14086 stop:14628 length:543 start_codon:yes stop_codon:yes gene_type:complete